MAIKYFDSSVMKIFTDLFSPAATKWSIQSICDICLWYRQKSLLRKKALFRFLPHETDCRPVHTRLPALL